MTETIDTAVKPRPRANKVAQPAPSGKTAVTLSDHIVEIISDSGEGAQRCGQSLGATLLHEWLHLVAFASAIQLWRFKRADAIEPLPPLALEPLNFGDRNTGAYEAWCDLGETLLGYDESAARQIALASPVHAMILWRCVERTLRRTPLRFRSSRFRQLMQRGDFMRAEVEPKARARRAKQTF